MKLFTILTDTAPPKVFTSLLLGTLAGIGYALLIPIVLNSFDGDSAFAKMSTESATFLGFDVSNYKFAALYLIACSVILSARTLSQLMLSRVAIDTTYQLRLKYYDRIAKSPLPNLEKVGSSRLIASIMTDVKAIIQGAMLLPDLLISTVTIFGMMCFLLYLNLDIFLFICGAIAFGSVTYMIPMLFAGRLLKSARDKVDRLQEAVRGNIYGVKELKLCESKRNSFFSDVLLKVENDVKKINKKAITIVRAGTNYGDMISFFVIGFVAFILLNYHSISTSELLGAVMVLLYITGPISVVMNALPEIITANISLVKVETLFQDIPEEAINNRVRPLPDWQSLRFKDVTFKHTDIEHTDEKGFSLGPISFEIKKGEVTFIVGGNGSGKSTLAKLITSHYLPRSGQVFVGDCELDSSLVNSFRNEISAIYSDFYLFDRLLGTTKHADKTLIDNYLARLKLAHKVSLDKGRFSTLALSDGQRKRLALLIAFLEDKHLYLFDEWAADQDPEFKQIFYQEILPYLKSKGKAVVVITHDDRYFEVADRVFSMEEGQLQSVNTTSTQSDISDGSKSTSTNTEIDSGTLVGESGVCV